MDTSLNRPDGPDANKSLSWASRSLTNVNIAGVRKQETDIDATRGTNVDPPQGTNVDRLQGTDVDKAATHIYGQKPEPSGLAASDPQLATSSFDTRSPDPSLAYLATYPSSGPLAVTSSTIYPVQTYDGWVGGEEILVNVIPGQTRCWPQRANEPYVTPVKYWETRDNAKYEKYYLGYLGRVRDELSRRLLRGKLKGDKKDWKRHVKLHKKIEKRRQKAEKNKTFATVSTQTPSEWPQDGSEPDTTSFVGQMPSSHSSSRISRPSALPAITSRLSWRFRAVFCYNPG